ncbi:MAG: hypothetical protein D6801_04915 [Alphaproteobacteria bacterium]|nr:MAG: hypothetical protein D6801_04915 [Alphaproteobacteria bacterium]
MPSQASIIKAMQFDFIYSKNPINTSSDPRRVITYQFAGNSQPADFGDFNSSYSGWTKLSKGEKRTVNKMLKHVETFLNVDFQQVKNTPDPDMNIGKVTLPTGIAGYGGPKVMYSGKNITDYDSYAVYDRNINLKNGQNALILHEVGHALGLKHPFEGAVLLDNKYDNNHYTLMSYTADPTHSGDNKVMMLYDILALQDIWGAATYHAGNNTYDGPRVSGTDVIWDTGGKDTFDASARSNKTKLDLRDGHFSKFGTFQDVAIAFGVTIENAKGGSNNDKIIGNSSANTLNGNGGNDTIKGGGGADTIKGGKGNDKLIGGGGADTFVFAKGDGHDTIRDHAAGEHIEISGHGNTAAIIAAASDSGGDVVIDFGNGDVITVLHTTVAALQADLFAV